MFDLAGAPLYEWGEHAVMPLDGEGRLHYPAAMAVSADASVAAVVEPFDGRCQVFGNSPEAVMYRDAVGGRKMLFGHIGAFVIPLLLTIALRTTNTELACRLITLLPGEASRLTLAIEDVRPIGDQDLLAVRRREPSS